MELKNNSIISRKPQMVFNKIDDEIVMLSIENNEYYGLNNIGSRIWEIIDKPIVYAELINQLLEEFDVEKEKCEQDVNDFIEKLDKKGLVEIKNVM